MAAFAAFLAPFFWWSLLTTTFSEGTVLDPSMYLLPSPPMTTHDDPGLVWSQTLRVTRDAGTHTYANEKTSTSTESSESMEGAETFWPSLRTSYGLGGIHIPMTFSVSGTYGSGYHGYGTGVVGSSYSSLFGNTGTGLRTGVAGTYGSVSADEPINTFGNYGKSSLAGSSYGSYGSYPGVRVFGNPGKTGWSGWGNGKWGHYGKG